MQSQQVFQSTHPMRGETKGGCRSDPPYPFQSTHPMRGETNPIGEIRNGIIYFNPLTPCGVRRIVRKSTLLKTNFNPLTPCGVRQTKNRDQKKRRQFQSTHPMRGETLAARLLHDHQTFQSTHPMRGETAFMPQISSAHKCICTKPAHEFSGSYIPSAEIHLIAVLIAQKIRCEPSRESMVTSPSRGYALKPCSRLRFILIIHQQFPPWQVSEAPPPIPAVFPPT